MPKPKPVFIFGVARSGTNLLARAIGAHPQASVALDPLMPLFKAWRNGVAEPLSDRLVHPFQSASAFQDYYFEADGPILLDAMLSADPRLPIAEIQALRQSVCERAALESPALADALDALDGETVGEIFASAFAIIADWARAEGRRDLAVAGIKEVWTLEFARPLAQKFPDARFLVIHRDPRAVLASLIELMRKDPGQAAHTVSYMRHWRKQVALTGRLLADPSVSDRLKTVRFEDLLARPEAELTALCGFLHLPMHPDMLALDRDDTWRGNSSFHEGGTGINTAASERWRDRLSPAMAATTEYHCAPEMAAIGYAVDRQAGELTDAIRNCVADADRHPGKWRSDSGDVAADLAWEARRWDMLATGAADAAEIRRCFLFEQVYEDLVSATAGDTPEEWEIAE